MLSVFGVFGTFYFVEKLHFWREAALEPYRGVLLPGRRAFFMFHKF